VTAQAGTGFAGPTDAYINDQPSAAERCMRNPRPRLVTLSRDQRRSTRSHIRRAMIADPKRHCGGRQRDAES